MINDLEGRFNAFIATERGRYRANLAKEFAKKQEEIHRDSGRDWISSESPSNAPSPRRSANVPHDLDEKGPGNEVGDNDAHSDSIMYSPAGVADTVEQVPDERTGVSQRQSGWFPPSPPVPVKAPLNQMTGGTAPR